MKQLVISIGRWLSFVFFSLLLMTSLAVILVREARDELMGRVLDDALILVVLVTACRGWRMGLLTADHKRFLDRIRAGERVTGNRFERITLACAVIAKVTLAFSA